MISFDTNILVCAADAAAGERHLRAAALVERAIRAAIAYKPCSRFASSSTRKAGISPGIAFAFVAGWRAVTIVEPAGLADLDEAIRAVDRYRLAFWDALLWATIRRAGVRILITEDFHGHTMRR